MNKVFTVLFPKTPGAKMLPLDEEKAWSLPEARKLARKWTENRKDLKYQDVKIEKNNKFLEYAGPCR